MRVNSEFDLRFIVKSGTMAAIQQDRLIVTVLWLSIDVHQTPRCVQSRC